MSDEELIQNGEETADPGGYFIIRGYLKFIRLLIMPRANYVILIHNQKMSFFKILA